MKHNLKITLILTSMFIITQIIGLFVVMIYTNGLTLPYGMQPPQELNENNSIISILFAFVIAITLFFFLTKFKAETFIRIWFFAVTTLALGLTLTAFLYKLNFNYNISLIAILIALPLSYFKIIHRNLTIHNLTELLIYPGIAAVFVPLLNILGIIIFLLIISLYDIWAVWHSEFMQKMAKYQIENLKFFTGFFVPYTGRKEKLKIKELKQKYKDEKELEKQFKKSKIKIRLAILGGGDIIFPIITAGVFYKISGLIPALIIMFSSVLAILFLFILARKGKFYPAMPFLTIGMYLGMIVSWLV